MLFLRLVVMIFAVELLFFFLLRLYFRSLRAEHLEELWEQRHPSEAGDTPRRETFVRRAMRGFEHSLKVRLTWAVFIIPTLTVMAIVYWVNWQ